MAGISSMQGLHQGAQKFRKTTSPRCADRRSVPPSAACPGRAISGARAGKPAVNTGLAAVGSRASQEL